MSINRNIKNADFREVFIADDDTSGASKQLLNDLYNISKYNHIFHRYEKPPVAIYMLYLNFKRYRYKIYIRYLKKYLILSNKIKIDVCKKCGNFYCGTNTKISINAICKCNKIDMTLFISNN
jgi:hypothetical protein